MTSIQIICPSCGDKGNIEVAPDALKHVTRGLLAINIPASTICQHSFIAYLDRNLHVRDYFVADFQIELPEMPIPDSEKFRESKIPSKDIVDIDLIKLNMTALLLTHVLKSIFSRQKTLLIIDYEFLFQHIHNFFDYVTRDTFDTQITIITENDYNKDKKQYKDYMVLKGNEIVKNVNKILNDKKLGVEKHIVSKFLTEQELGYSYILLKNEIQKAYELSTSIVEFVKDKKKSNEKANILEASANLEQKYSIKISPMYLNFLNEIVKNYYGMTVPSASQSFLGSL